jgi:hypothetical protein
MRMMMLNLSYKKNKSEPKKLKSKISKNNNIDKGGKTLKIRINELKKQKRKQTK